MVAFVINYMSIFEQNFACSVVWWRDLNTANGNATLLEPAVAIEKFCMEYELVALQMMSDYLRRIYTQISRCCNHPSMFIVRFVPKSVI